MSVTAPPRPPRSSDPSRSSRTRSSDRGSHRRGAATCTSAPTQVRGCRAARHAHRGWDVRGRRAHQRGRSQIAGLLCRPHCRLRSSCRDHRSDGHWERRAHRPLDPTRPARQRDRRRAFGGRPTAPGCLSSGADRCSTSCTRTDRARFDSLAGATATTLSGPGTERGSRSREVHEVQRRGAGEIVRSTSSARTAVASTGSPGDPQ